MRIKEGFELREICGEHLILSHGMDNIDFSKIISLVKINMLPLVVISFMVI